LRPVVAVTSGFELAVKKAVETWFEMSLNESDHNAHNSSVNDAVRQPK